ncbi:DUF2309 domain-containing protein [Salinirubellus salinus]|uniref:Probable inorganic carbon transporter subunit DabA n=1 Tax=Salinirubellus salinus TaxID=1364945 RepID=A0A9E7U9R8_9EURY|nr:DUF2309 domain-containing protein [Salinirubellus salinus]UWM53297.1 DUF2309 domain-containing protein [Salinirubellus salinus]
MTETGTDVVRTAVDRAAQSVAPVWPLHSFVTANPLAGFEDRPFDEAVRAGSALFGGRGYPSAETFRRAWAADLIAEGHLREQLSAAGIEERDPETLLERLSAAEAETATRPTDEATARVDRLLTKWLAVFLDEGKADWPMPNREDGFYAAFRAVVRYDRAIPDRATLADLPDDPEAAVERVLAGHPADCWPEILETHLTALPGWTGLMKHRAEAGEVWQRAAPVTLTEYLAVRLTLVDLCGAPVDPEVGTATDDDGEWALADAWLAAWEATYREELVGALTEASAALDGEATADGGRPDAQLAFCIDTRSEVFRRHLEAAGDYETLGYAGFFGVPMRFRGYDDAVSAAACPPILDPGHNVEDRPVDGHEAERAAHDRWTSLRSAASGLFETLKSNAATAFSFVESAGSGYGLALAARTLRPRESADAAERAVGSPDTHEFCEPTVAHDPDAETGDDLPLGMTHEEQVEYAAGAFDLMGVETFARLVCFVGHAGETANNPFESSLDCGACAGNPGGPNARVLAAICNDESVRASLAERGIEVPDDTVFVAGQHNTTTDEVTLFDGPVSESHAADLASLRESLATARRGAAAERVADMGLDREDALAETERRAADWAETRPEWGLAGNAAFVVGPRELTADLDLDGRSFLHSYDWRTDDDGSALEAIVGGPMVVTQWINSQYYFASVDPDVYGSGSKVTHNPVGNVGVYRGNGGDLATGLPLQSVRATDDDPYHQPLRLSVVIHTPVDRVTDVLASQSNVASLLDEGWLSLTVVDPTREHRAFTYDGDLTWEPAVRVEATPTAADGGNEVGVESDD